MESPRIIDHPDYLKAREIQRSELAHRAKAEALGELAERTSEPLVALFAHTAQITESRCQGAHEAAVVLLAETLARIDQANLQGLPRMFARNVLMGLADGVASALDVPEVDFAAVDELLDKLEPLAAGMGVRPFLIWHARIRRFAMAGEEREAAFWADRLVPHINITNRLLNGLDCPSCALGYVGWLRGPLVAPGDLETMFQPVFDHSQAYPGDDKEWLAEIWKGASPPECPNGQQICFTVYGRSLLHAGRTEDAGKEIDKARALPQSEIFLLPNVASIEVALAKGAPDAIDRECDDLAPRAARHEDIEERFLAELRLVQAHRTRGRAAPTDAVELSAERLDRRLGRDTYRKQLARELAEGPAFPLADPARRPSFLAK